MGQTLHLEVGKMCKPKRKENVIGSGAGRVM